MTERKLGRVKAGESPAKPQRVVGKVYTAEAAASKDQAEKDRKVQDPPDADEVLKRESADADERV